MFPASFRRSPNVLVLLHLSEPARSHRDSLREPGEREMSPGQLREVRNTLPQSILNPSTDAHYSLRQSLDLSPINPQEFDGENTVAERRKQHRKQD